jgi:DNA polymerase-3 subunit epsilon
MTVADLAQELATQLTLERPLVCLDLETTGTVSSTDRVVQIATAAIAPDGQVTTWSTLVNPQRPIPAESTAIHGISDAMVATAPTFADLVPVLTTLLESADLAGYNIQRFDRQVLAAEFQRVGAPDPTRHARVVDAYRILTRQEPRRLDDALRLYHMEDAAPPRRPHDAASDVEATVAVLVGQFRAYPDAPRTVDALHQWLFPRDPSWIDEEGKLAWRNGEASINFGAHTGRPLVDLAVDDRGVLEWILRKDFPEDVKAIVRDALAGRFPTRPVTN